MVTEKAQRRGQKKIKGLFILAPVNYFTINAETNFLNRDWKTLQLPFNKTTSHAKKSGTFRRAVTTLKGTQGIPTPFV